MNYRNAVLIDGKSLAADNTEYIDLRGLTPISEIVVSYKYTNNGSTPTEHPAACISQIQVIDGSNVIYDLTGKQARALAFYHYKKSPTDAVSYIDNNQGTVIVRIPFGAYLWDPNLAFDPARFNNPQLIVKTDLNGGGSAPDAGVLEVVAMCFDELAINPSGYLIAKEHYKYSVVASGQETIPLPVDLVVKMLMLQGDYKDTALIQQINKIKISEDHGKHIPYDNNASDLIKMLSPDMEQYMEKIRFNGTTSAVEYFITPFYEATAILGGIMATPNYGSATQSDGGTMDIDMSAAGECDGIVTGWCPHGCIGIEFGDMYDPSAWYNPGAHGIKSLEVLLTAGASASSSGQNKVVMQQLKKY